MPANSTAEDWTASRDAKTAAWKEAIGFAILAASVAISVKHILSGSGVVPGAPMDQHFVNTVQLQIAHSNGHWIFQYPNLQNAGGISSSLAAGIYKLIIPTSPQTLNWHFRIFCMLAQLGSSFYLFKTTINNWGLRMAAFMIVATSGIQLLEPSSEVITTAFLNLFLVAALKRWPRPLTALFLVLFGLGKVELCFAALIMAVIWFAYERRQGIPKPYLTLAYTLLWMAAFLMPALVLEGANPFKGSRSTVAFLSAYSGFLKFHQFQQTIPSNAEAMKATSEIIFSDSKSFIDVVVKHPALYLDYLGISAARSLPNIALVFKLMLIPAALVLTRWRKTVDSRFLILCASAAAICILLPSWLVIFVRMRYIAKVLPVITAATMAGALELSPAHPFLRRLTWACSILTILWQGLALSPYQD